MGFIDYSYKKVLKPQLFKQDPEDVHDRFISVGNKLGSNSVTRGLTKTMLRYDNPKLTQEICGITFSNPIGLSAGFDKDANLHNILYEVGFGFMQVGSITLNPYEGNPKPRLHRLPNSEGLVVYYGLKNDGASVIAEKLKDRKNSNFPLSISIAKTNCDATSTMEGGIKDYVGSVKLMEEKNLGDMYTINISCPNTFGGEPFTTPEKLESLLEAIYKVKPSKPIFVKMPINLPWEEFDSLLQVILKYKVDGVIIGNLTKVRDPNLIKDEIPEGMSGGISGLPTKELCNNLISKTYKAYSERLVIIGVGGVFNADDAYEKIKLGASLVQLITGMIYGGPNTIGDINRGLVRCLERDGFKNISEAIGTDINK